MHTAYGLWENIYGEVVQDTRYPCRPVVKVLSVSGARVNGRISGRLHQVSL